MKKRNFLCIFLVTFLFWHCKEERISPYKDCTNLETLTNGWGQSLFRVEHPAFEMPYFNPNNSDEIIFRYADGSSLDYHLIKYNLRTKEQQIIFTGQFNYRIRWGKNDWILLNIPDILGTNVYKIRSDGTELTRLTTSGNCFYPEWDVYGEKIIYQYAFTTPTQGILINQNGIFLDTILCPSTGFSSWQHPDYLATGFFSGLRVANPINCDTKLFVERESNSQSLNGAEWIDENNVIWCHTTGIYLTNIETEETELIKETCNSDTYQLPTYAPDINKVIFQRMERILDTESSGRIILSLVMMNLDGTEDETIEIE